MLVPPLAASRITWFGSALSREMPTMRRSRSPAGTSHVVLAATRPCPWPRRSNAAAAFVLARVHLGPRLDGRAGADLPAEQLRHTDLAVGEVLDRGTCRRCAPGPGRRRRSRCRGRPRCARRGRAATSAPTGGTGMGGVCGGYRRRSPVAPRPAGSASQVGCRWAEGLAVAHRRQVDRRQIDGGMSIGGSSPDPVSPRWRHAAGGPARAAGGPAPPSPPRSCAPVAPSSSATATGT